MANFDAVWLPQWRRAKTRAYRAKKSKKKVCSDYLFENSCKTVILDFSRAIVHIYVSLLASELGPFIAEGVPYLVTRRSLKMVALCSDQERTGG